MSGSKVFLLLAWPSGVATLEVVETEYEGDEGTYVPLRADHRIDETYVSTSSPGEWVTLELPYRVPSEKRGLFVAYSRLDNPETGEQRGDLLDFEWLSDNAVRIHTSVIDPKLWFGAVPIANRIKPKPYLTNRDGAALIVDGMTIKSVRVSHTNTSTYKFIVRSIDGQVTPDTYSARQIGDPSIRNDKVAISRSGEATFDVGLDVNEVELELVNDTIYPSSWDSLQYRLQVTTKGG